MLRRRAPMGGIRVLLKGTQESFVPPFLPQHQVNSVSPGRGPHPNLTMLAPGSCLLASKCFLFGSQPVSLGQQHEPIKTEPLLLTVNARGWTLESPSGSLAQQRCCVVLMGAWTQSWKERHPTHVQFTTDNPVAPIMKRAGRI